MIDAMHLCPFATPWWYFVCFSWVPLVYIEFQAITDYKSINTSIYIVYVPELLACHCCPQLIVITSHKFNLNKHMIQYYLYKKFLLIENNKKKSCKI